MAAPTSLYPHRHAFRARWHDYDSGVYFITICVKNHRQFFCSIKEGKMLKYTLGNIAEQQIVELPAHFPWLEIWNYVVMPNHIHVVLYIAPTSEINLNSNSKGCLKEPKHGGESRPWHYNAKLSVVVRSLKGGVDSSCEQAWNQI